MPKKLLERVPCAFPACERDSSRRGLCGSHYTQQRRGGALADLRFRPVRQERALECTHAECERKHYAKGWCRAHYQQCYVGEAPRNVVEYATPSTIRIDGDTAWVAVYDRRGGVVAEASIDASDIPLVVGLRWHRKGRYVAASTGSRSKVLMHRLVCPPPVGLEVDHRNGDGLDNRRANLRAVTHAENLLNLHTPVRAKSGERNIRLTRHGTWAVQVGRAGHVGVFRTLAEAVVARDEHRRRLTVES